MLAGGCPGPSVGVNIVVRSVCGVLSSVHLVFPSSLGCLLVALVVYVLLLLGV